MRIYISFTCVLAKMLNNFHNLVSFITFALQSVLIFIITKLTYHIQMISYIEIFKMHKILIISFLIPHLLTLLVKSHFITTIQLAVLILLLSYTMFIIDTLQSSFIVHLVEMVRTQKVLYPFLSLNIAVELLSYMAFLSDNKIISILGSKIFNIIYMAILGYIGISWEIDRKILCIMLGFRFLSSMCYMNTFSKGKDRNYKGFVGVALIVLINIVSLVVIHLLMLKNRLLAG